MNSDSEAISRQFFAWLLQDTATVDSQPFGDDESTSGDDPFTATAGNGGGESSGWRPQTLELGEIPAVENRFQAVLERRLKVEIESHPPLFPWETEVFDYPDYVDNPLSELVPLSLWAAQQNHLLLPMSLPEHMFQQLLLKCQEIVQTSLQLGQQLIQAVESFFPDESYMILNEVAGRVLMSSSPHRDGRDILETMPNLESSYEDLIPQQQMVLSFLTAKQVLESLLLQISTTNPVVERQWTTSAGLLTLQVQYQFQAAVPKLRVECELPAPGIVTLKGDSAQAMAESSHPDTLSLELSCLRLNQRYTLEVQFPELDPQPLMFTILLNQ